MGWALKSFRYQFDEPGTQGSSSLAWHPLGIRNISAISKSARDLQSFSQTFSPTTSKPSVFVSPAFIGKVSEFLASGQTSLSSLECRFQCQFPFIPSFLRLRSPEPSTPLSEPRPPSSDLEVSSLRGRNLVSSLPLNTHGSFIRTYVGSFTLVWTKWMKRDTMWKQKSPRTSLR